MRRMPQASPFPTPHAAARHYEHSSPLLGVPTRARIGRTHPSPIWEYPPERTAATRPTQCFRGIYHSVYSVARPSGARRMIQRFR